MEFSIIAIIAALTLALQPAKPPDRVILLPDADGQIGRVIVSSASSSQELAESYAAVTVSRAGKIAAYQESEEAVKTRHGELLAALPNAPKSYLLYFQSGGSELTPESEQTLAELRHDAQGRAAPEIRVIGHTDRVGSEASNEALSLQRAQAIVEKFKGFGIQAKSFEVVGRGELDLLVPTADEVDEPRNRRVEVSIR
jgi:outer membrane protein OmpA-like peptidoglycan-associated protein